MIKVSRDHMAPQWYDMNFKMDAVEPEVVNIYRGHVNGVRKIKSDMPNGSGDIDLFKPEQFELHLDADSFLIKAVVTGFYPANQVRTYRPGGNQHFPKWLRHALNRVVYIRREIVRMQTMTDYELRKHVRDVYKLTNCKAFRGYTKWDRGILIILAAYAIHDPSYDPNITYVNGNGQRFIRSFGRY